MPDDKEIQARRKLLQEVTIANGTWVCTYCKCRYDAGAGLCLSSRLGDDIGRWRWRNNHWEHECKGPTLQVSHHLAIPDIGADGVPAGLPLTMIIRDDLEADCPPMTPEQRKKLVDSWANIVDGMSGRITIVTGGTE